MARSLVSQLDTSWNPSAMVSIILLLLYQEDNFYFLGFLLSVNQVHTLSQFSFTFSFSLQIFNQFLTYVLQIRSWFSARLQFIYLLVQLSNIRAPKSKIISAIWSEQSYIIWVLESNLASAPYSSHIFHIQKDVGSIQAGKTKSTPLFSRIW